MNICVILHPPSHGPPDPGCRHGYPGSGFGAHPWGTSTETGTGAAGMRVATETCGQMMPLKLSSVFCEYWIWVEVTVAWKGVVTAPDGVTENTGVGAPEMASAGMVSGGWPGAQVGTVTVLCTVSIQKVALNWVTWAFGADAFLSPLRKAMFSAPPPNRGLTGLAATDRAVVDVMVCLVKTSRRTVLGSFSMAWVMVPFAMNVDRSCGIRAVLASVAVWLGNGPLDGVMVTGGGDGGPAKVRNVPWQLIVVPCGIEAIRTRLVPSPGSLVPGTIIHSPGSKWMPTGADGSVMSVTVCT